MKRVTAFLIAFMAFWVSLTAFADLQIIEGQHYQKVPPEILENTLIKELANQTPDQTMVLEFFSYGCVGCFKLDPLIETWRAKLPEKVNFQRIPVEFHTEWRNLTKAYYTALGLNAYDKIHAPLFDAIHNNKLTSASSDALREFFTSNGVAAKDFDQEFDSFSINRKQKWANSITRAYKVTAVPAVIVQGPHGAFITTARLAGSQENMIAVLEHLLTLAQQPTLDAVLPSPAPDAPAE